VVRRRWCGGRSDALVVAGSAFGSYEGDRAGDGPRRALKEAGAMQSNWKRGGGGARGERVSDQIAR